MKKIGIMGMGYVGLPLWINFSKNGFQAVGFDAKKEIVTSLINGKSYIGHIPSADIKKARKVGSYGTSDMSKIQSVDAIIICAGKSSKSADKLNDKKFISSFKSNFLSVSNTIESYQKVYNNKPTKIIVISSIAALKVINAPVEYSVSKSALNHYCKIHMGFQLHDEHHYQKLYYSHYQ